MDIKYKILTTDFYSVDECRRNPKDLYIFGDNLSRVGNGGQAIIRHEPNSMGIATKMTPGEYFTDDNFDFNRGAIYQDIERIKKYVEEKGFEHIIFPSAGLGWGRAEMQTRCPKTALYLCQKLLHDFGFNNLREIVNKHQF